MLINNEYYISVMESTEKHILQRAKAQIEAGVPEIPMSERVDTEDLIRILIEVTHGVEPKTPDTPQQAAKRQQLKVAVDEISARGGIVEVPF
jgi:hypothetical protein